MTDNATENFGEIISFLIKDGLIARDKVEYAERVRSKLVAPRSLLDVLKELNYITDEQIKTTLRNNKITMRIGDLLVELGILTQEKLAAAFDIQKKEEIPTPYFGLNFSPDGKYYFVESAEGNTARLFLRETNEEIKLEDKGIKPWFHFYEWEVRGENTFVYLYDYVKVSKRFWKLDCANGKITHLAKPDEAIEAVGVLNGNLLWSKTTANSEFEVFIK